MLENFFSAPFSVGPGHTELDSLPSPRARFLVSQMCYSVDAVYFLFLNAVLGSPQTLIGTQGMLVIFPETLFR
jgi:hypothetical protein